MLFVLLPCNQFTIFLIAIFIAENARNEYSAQGKFSRFFLKKHDSLMAFRN